MFKTSELLNALACVQRFFRIARASDMDEQVARMLRKNNAIKSKLELQIAKLAKSDFYSDDARKCRLENVLKDLVAWMEELQFLQSRMHADRFGIALSQFERDFWPLTIRLSTRYQSATGIFGDWLYDTNRLDMLTGEYIELCKAGDDGANSNSARLRKRLDSLKISEIGELKLCGDCGQTMIPCEDCGALVKPCFLEMGMTHICDSVTSDGAQK